MNAATAIVITDGLLASPFAKTCHGLLRGTERFAIQAVIDSKHAGKDAGEVMDGKYLGIPVVESIEAYLESAEITPEYCVVGIATAGGYIPEDLGGKLKNAIKKGMSIVCGLHTFLSEDPEFIALAEQHQVELIDIRKPKPRKELHFWSGEILKMTTPVIAVLGIDCAVGKRTTCRFLMETCRANGIQAEMIYTGQTGWMQGYPHGFIFDSTVNDFVSGELEHAILSCNKERQPDLILLEGQSALRNPSGPCGSEFILSGNAKGVILQHAPSRKHYEDTEALLPSIESEIELIKFYGAEVLAVTLNESGFSERQIEAYRTDLIHRIDLPIIRPLNGEMDQLIPLINDWLAI